MTMKSTFYSLLSNYISVYIRPGNTILEISPQHTLLLENIEAQRKLIFQPASPKSKINNTFKSFKIITSYNEIRTSKPDTIILNGTLHYERDIQVLLETLKSCCVPETRLVALYYNNLWRPFITCATSLGIRYKTKELNWIAHEDIENLCKLAGFETIHLRHHILIPFTIPFISSLCNRYLANFPLFKIFTLVNIVSIRPIIKKNVINQVSVSIIVPVRNEAGNIQQIINRIPNMGPDDEIIFVEGGSSDNSWETIRKIATSTTTNKIVRYIQQDGSGKGDAVRKGFSMASNEILMILDADLSVGPEELTKFYNAIIENKGELIIGSRLVYPMRPGAMRFLNILGNKFFAIAFSYVLGQRFKDTLCGTKVLTKTNYIKIVEQRSFFGDFDPFGDFDLIFGANKLGMKILEIPVPYHERAYGVTNIRRWSQGLLLFKMLLFAAKKIKFI
jgi:GT2 family glycosyltransferase